MDSGDFWLAHPVSQPTKTAVMRPGLKTKQNKRLTFAMAVAGRRPRTATLVLPLGFCPNGALETRDDPFPLSLSSLSIF